MKKCILLLLCTSSVSLCAEKKEKIRAMDTRIPLEEVIQMKPEEAHTMRIPYVTAPGEVIITTPMLTFPIETTLKREYEYVHVRIILSDGETLEGYFPGTRVQELKEKYGEENVKLLSKEK